MESRIYHLPHRKRRAVNHTDALSVTERYQRRDLGHMELQITADDAKAYTRRGTVKLEMELRPDTELLEFICEHEKYHQRVFPK